MSPTNTFHQTSLWNGRRSSHHPNHTTNQLVFLYTTTQRLCGSDSSPTLHLPSIRTAMEIQNPLSTRQNTVLVLYRTTGGPMPDSLRPRVLVFCNRPTDRPEDCSLLQIPSRNVLFVGHYGRNRVYWWEHDCVCTHLCTRPRD